MKPTLRLTEADSRMWIMTLEAHDTWMVLRAILKVGYSEADFINIGKVVSEIGTIRKEYQQWGVPPSLPKHLRDIARHMGAVVDPPPASARPKAISRDDREKTRQTIRGLAEKLRAQRGMRQPTEADEA